MTVRNGLLGLGAFVVMAGAGAADSPRGPLVEGREPNPVARQFYEPEPRTFGYGGGPVAREEGPGLPAPGVGPVGMPWDLMLNEFTVPLGTVPMWD
jgi:hypothetical protein